MANISTPNFQNTRVGRGAPKKKKVSAQPDISDFEKLVSAGVIDTPLGTAAGTPQAEEQPYNMPPPLLPGDLMDRGDQGMVSPAARYEGGSVRTSPHYQGPPVPTYLDSNVPLPNRTAPHIVPTPAAEVADFTGPRRPQLGPAGRGAVSEIPDIAPRWPARPMAQPVSQPIPQAQQAVTQPRSVIGSPGFQGGSPLVPPQTGGTTSRTPQDATDLADVFLARSQASPVAVPNAVATTGVEGGDTAEKSFDNVTRLPKQVKKTQPRGIVGSTVGKLQDWASQQRQSQTDLYKQAVAQAGKQKTAKRKLTNPQGRYLR